LKKNLNKEILNLLSEILYILKKNEENLSDEVLIEVLTLLRENLKNKKTSKTHTLKIKDKEDKEEKLDSFEELEKMFEF